MHGNGLELLMMVTDSFEPLCKELLRRIAEIVPGTNNSPPIVEKKRQLVHFLLSRNHLSTSPMVEVGG
jgi:hypothetical protein